MARVEEMTNEEIKALLQKLDYGHLGCVRNNRPYVVPIHFAYEDPNIYIFTTEGMKTQILDENPEVCLQVEDVTDIKHWRSVIVNGRASRLVREDDRFFAMNFIEKVNPARVPALHEVWIGPKARKNMSAVYRIHLDFISGRKTVGKS
ncbi:MAG: Pyridoxamine 5-phosphate oxidase-related, FMN-binding protein [Acidobacteria bacterium]|jgi:nitroimidazol reductase NimA-like FMN-containing flavoprotein (pyridoxamine 5'-phosphate oxidase superfamily)|nr:Pyridoxamine 5-phosphate oxidase-related, FMN-binding protein [Acidobacteriota bacterium]